ncbi:MAG: cation-transporting P-type ATPase [Betaproteobacteria bacterium]|nr:cation-transporting P-type ATPase [Betaproteobacteria bacterium]
MEDNYVHTHARWFAKDAATVLEKLKTSPDKGLSAAQAAERLGEFGLNELPTAKADHAVVRFLRHFHDVLIYILFVCAFITLVLGHYVDTAVIILVAVINAVIGYFQENKAEKALNDIRNLLSLRASVVRDGARIDVDAAGLTLGDIVYLSPGDKIPADLRLFRAENLRVEESALTGETVPSEKGTLPLAPDTVLGDRSNMAYCGTTVSAGTGYGVVVDIGTDTELGRISQLINEVGDVTTPLIRQMATFGKNVSVVVIGIAALVYLFGHFFRKDMYGGAELLLSTIGLAIAAIPEGLPAILSIILAIGVQNMAKRNAIVRNLPSVETLGSVSVICSDKTGTLTRNEMTVKNLVVHDAGFVVTGSGYAPTGEIRYEDDPDSPGEGPLLRLLLTCFKHCNDASLSQETWNTWVVQGDPTEGALLTVFEKAGLDAKLPPRVATLPFDSEYKYMATLASDNDINVLYIKGAPDRLLGLAHQEMASSGPAPLEREIWEETVAELAAEGKRVLGAAIKFVPSDKTTVEHEDLREGVIFLGLAGIVDPPREEVVEAVAVCRAAGIRVKMITGDHADTARAIGRELGIGNGKEALTGNELDDMTDEQFYAAACQYDVFARTSPEHKLKLVKALQAHGAICAMTGDGVNDAPALRRADVGVAMGIKGTEVTKDAAEVVLADDNFSTIAAAVEEGRRVYDNLKKTILFILPTNGAESFLIIASILFGTMIPLTPVQILWVNMVTSVTISLALAFEPAEPGVMARPPRDAAEPLLSGYFVWRILFVSVMIGGLTLALSNWLLGLKYTVEEVRTITLQTIVLCQAFHLFNSRSIRQPAHALDFWGNKAVFAVCGLMVLLQLAVVYLPFMNTVFGTVPLGATGWLMPILLGVIVFLVVEGEKYVMRRLDAREQDMAQQASLNKPPS